MSTGVPGSGPYAKGKKKPPAKKAVAETPKKRGPRGPYKSRKTAASVTNEPVVKAVTQAMAVVDAVDSAVKTDVVLDFPFPTGIEFTPDDLKAMAALLEDLLERLHEIEQAANGFPLGEALTSAVVTFPNRGPGGGIPWVATFRDGAWTVRFTGE